jgi:hypothetical protein
VNENQLTERMRAAVAGEPPLGFDPDELTDRAGRRQRQRRAVLGAVAATFVLAAGAVTVGAATQRVGNGDGHRVGGPPQALNCPQPMATLAPTVITRHIPGVALDNYDLECTQADHQYLVRGTGGRIWLYREKNRQDSTKDFFADNETAYHLAGETPVQGAIVRTYVEPSNSTDWWLRAAVWIGTDNLVVWAEVSGRGEPMATEEQLIALVSDPELRE